MDTIENFRLFDFLDHLKQMPLKEDALAAKENGVWKNIQYARIY